ncbi:MAG: deoxyribodipyrimidine photo-lyase [Gammaproteobacteria bacterium]
MGASVVWLRRDLRVHDHPALSAAAGRGEPLLLVYVLEDDDPWAPGGAMRDWLHRSLASLETELEKHGHRLVYLRGAACEQLPALVAAVGADALYCLRRYEPHGRAVDEALATTLAPDCTMHVLPGNLLFEPEAVSTGGGTPFRVFTPYYRACLQCGAPPAPLPPPRRWPAALDWRGGLSLAALELQPRIAWADGIRARWPAGEHAAHLALDTFLDERVGEYAARRDRPAITGTSALSPYLAVGALSARSAWQAAQQGGRATADAWLRQLVWREFAYHLLFHFPHTPTAPFRPEWSEFQWCEAPAALARWQRGETGIPLVDAGMRELWVTGYMHNRVRMVVASLLCKHLGVHWLAGARWFWDTLVDADLANNTLGWQWTAGCGADAAPYFRIFNPVSQGVKFDADGAYVRHWLPARAQLLDAAVHDLAVPATGYPAPIVDLAAGREAALARYAALKR